MLKNNQIMDLASFLNGTSYNTVSNDESYKMFQNIRKLNKVSSEISETIQELVKKDEPDFAEDGSIDLKTEKSVVFLDHYNYLMGDETEVELKKLSWDAFCSFCKENKINASRMELLSQVLLCEDD